MPIANRNRREIEGLIGFFVNTLVMRTNLGGDPTFQEVLTRVHEVSLGAYDHQDLPFEQLVEELRPERDTSRNPLFHILFAVQNVPFEGFSFPGLTMQPFATEAKTTRFDLECHIWPSPEGLIVTFIYNTDLFSRGTMACLAQYFQQVLESLVEDPMQRLSQLSLLSETDRQQMLIKWNDTSTASSFPQGIHQVVEEQVDQTPHSIAVVFGEEQLTYRELNTRANQLAHNLRRLGIGPEVLVGLCVNRSLDMVIGLLGILKAGGGYVPLDPTYPVDRLRFMLEETSTKVVVTHTALLPRLPPTSSHVLCLDRDRTSIAKEPTHNPCSRVTTENVAYVIYTSGSTGKPKGVALCHRTLTNLIAWQRENQRTSEGGARRPGMGYPTSAKSPRRGGDRSGQPGAKPRGHRLPCADLRRSL